MKIYKIDCGISPEILHDLFPVRLVDQYNLKNRSQSIIPNAKLATMVLEV